MSALERGDRRKNRAKTVERSRRAVPRQFLIVVEGKRELQYLKAFQHSGVVLKPEMCGLDPLGMVSKANRLMLKAEKEERRGKGSAFDEVWCVFDVDEHERFGQAVASARNNGVQLAISNPCFELWLLLHYQDQTAHLTVQAAQNQAAEFVGTGKTLAPAAVGRLVSLYDEANRRAAELAGQHGRHGVESTSNPSSGVGRLVDAIRRNRVT
ncbi:MAG: RloB domain-containing protein [Acidimicrobiia bacterium]|nr:RloB domain-containing protein [Acidimicrobiia bacterium]